MDVSVSHLNNRLALQLPAQLPLGLVFVLGKVERCVDGDNGRSLHKQFDLVEKEHRVRCVLSERVMVEEDVQEGSTIRAGGHLIFDPKRADYYLLVRDVEIVQAQPVSPAVSQVGMASMMAEVQKRAAAEALVQSELPPWVKKLSPVEFREPLGETNGEVVFQESDVTGAEKNQLAQLTAAMDSDEDVELTSSLLEVAKKLNQARGIQIEENNSFGMPPPVMGAYYAYPTDIEDPDAYTPTGKITSDRILVLVIIVALMLFLMIMLLFIVRGF
ncbi:MAG: exodeoxyribonuclease VII large subunit [Anaerolineae bacterium]|nr:exodeoxyribonuclease VII large subunit [Anaerolineae bacterium]